MDSVPNVLRASWPTPDKSAATRGQQDPIVAKQEGHSVRLNDYIPASGPTTFGSLAQTEKFVVRLQTLSAWLMGYTAQYLRHWETAKSRKSPAK
jgi:hypothetical protein